MAKSNSDQNGNENNACINILLLFMQGVF